MKTLKTVKNTSANIRVNNFHGLTALTIITKNDVIIMPHFIGNAVFPRRSTVQIFWES